MKSPANASARKPAGDESRQLLGLSTSWQAFRHTSGLGLIEEIIDLGFDAVELSFNLTASMVDEVSSLVDNKAVRVLSCHNFCPIPNGVKREEALPDFFSLSSANGMRRRRAVHQAKITIDTAACMGARAVVLHTGRVEIPDRTRQLMSMYALGLKGSTQYEALKQDMIVERNRYKKLFIDRLIKSLEEVCRYAGSRDIDVGMETRFYYREIPTCDEIGYILEKLDGSSLKYWHDTGHAQVMENLGFVRHEDFLSANHHKLLGMHIHNVIGCEDHLPLPRGDVDLNMVVSYLTKSTIKIIEAHHPATADEIKQSRELLVSLLGDRL